ncbi:MAG: DUF2334 domain-containing protein [Deltaproteobacteria bacterium]|nr:DUF2334 domain-containing protein [Deltaproteobacteria bacterium]
MGLALAAFGVARPAAASSVIYYDGTGGADDGTVYANLLMNLAGHFDGEITTRNVLDYAAGDMNGFDHVFYVGTDYATAIPEAFYADVSGGTRPVLWIYENFKHLTDYLGGSGDLGFEFADWSAGSGWDFIDYKNRMSPRAVDPSFIDVDVTGSPTIYSYLSTGAANETDHPHFLCAGNGFCFLAEIPMVFEGWDDRMLVLADLLHEFYGTGAAENLRALMRFEDLNPYLAQPEKLAHVANLLEERDVPFGFGVIPIYRDPAGEWAPAGTELPMSEAPDFLDALNNLLAAGGTMVMHGTTHQYGDSVSGYGWEFSLGLDNEPVPEDARPWATERVEWGLAEFWSQGWDPKIWETPHYSASHGDYDVFNEYFDFMWERPLVFPVPPDADPIFGTYLEPVSQALPFYSMSSSLGMGMLPENSGYIDRDEGQTPDMVIARAQRLTIVRDAVACFAYHHTQVDDADLLAVVDGLKALGYTFVSPEEFTGDDGMDPPMDDDTGGDDDDDTASDDDEMPESGDDDDDDDSGCGCL